MEHTHAEHPGPRPAVCLLSGGLDSATVLAIARREGFACHALSFDYGQRHRFELEAARRVARALGAVDHRIVRLDLTAGGGFGHSALTDDIAVPKDRSDLAPAQAGPKADASGQLEMGNGESPPACGKQAGAIPITYVPARNTIFLSIALACAEVVGAFDIFLGVNAVDYSGYPDCRGEFIEAFERLANLATAAAVQGQGRYRIHAPLIHMSKERIIRTGLSLGVDYGLTHSCYDPAADGAACGHCDSCRLRLAGFAAAGAADPAPYRKA
jgi:7-cyano-7-deazaguanine synthase